jgi:predicted DNA-binding transcriptional regulator YafY
MEPPRSRGYEFMDLLLECCKVGIPISFVHYSYKNERFKPIVLHPYVVREFDNRWYLFGYSEKHDAYRSFGLDRIYEPIKLDLHYKKGNTKQILRFLNDMYGVFSLGVEEPIEVVLNADPLTTKFFAAYPIHESQVVSKSTSGSSRISLTLIPTMELIHLVWSYGPSMRISSPEWLKEKQHALKYNR